VLPACTKANSENEARVIVRGIAKPVVASSLIVCGRADRCRGAEAMTGARPCPISTRYRTEGEGSPEKLMLGGRRNYAPPD
jgi:hypothetical protein